MLLQEDIKKEDFEESVIDVARVTKVVKGGRRFRFAALVVVGDKNGHVGCGTGKAKEVPDAVAKAVDDAFKNLIKVNVRGSSIAHEVKEKFNASQVFLKPASEGTGVIAGGAARFVLELAGIQDILTKSIGSNNPGNLVRATIKALSKLKNKSKG